LPDCPRNFDRQQCSWERTLIFPIRGSADGTQETVNPAFFVYREWLLYVKIWDWYRVCSFLRLNAFYLLLIELANSSVNSKTKTKI
jgi:hypothetical protein